MKSVVIYTDGACSGNPGKGGWAAILIYKGQEKEMSGAENQTTNNRMELTAVAMSLKALKEPCNVTLNTDSKYISDAINKGWLTNWIAHSWVKSDKNPVLNVDLWQEITDLLKIHNVKFMWVKGHNKDKYNERCDTLAVNAYLNM